ncbi:MAG TPA: hypothetical protein VFE61_22305 [Candidatus Sulfotelmatobacter sp.]|jgi:hypothetical protein|nr:hypothetical protein [Candidatus Sulfotelmatobacter sp.]
MSQYTVTMSFGFGIKVGLTLHPLAAHLTSGAQKEFPKYWMGIVYVPEAISPKSHAPRLFVLKCRTIFPPEQLNFDPRQDSSGGIVKRPKGD